MDRLSGHEFILALKEASLREVDLEIQALQKSYDEFAMTVFSESIVSEDRTDYCHSLVATRDKLLSIKEKSQKNALAYLLRTVELIDQQISHARWYMEAEGTVKNLSPMKQPLTENLKWTGGTDELVELIYALYLSKRINNGDITLRELFDVMEEAFNVDLTDFSHYLSNISHRENDGKAKFIDQMKAALLERMREADRKASKK